MRIHPHARSSLPRGAIENAARAVGPLGPEDLRRAVAPTPAWCGSVAFGAITATAHAEAAVTASRGHRRLPV